MGLVGDVLFNEEVLAEREVGRGHLEGTGRRVDDHYFADVGVF